MIKVAIASDHAGVELKKSVFDFLSSHQYDPVDCGPATSASSVDYPDYAVLVASKITSHECLYGILICGTGIGMCISANKIPGIRAALVFDAYTAKVSREHNDANILCLGSRTLSESQSLDLIKIWLTTEFAAGRHIQRLKKIEQIEKDNLNYEKKS